MPLDLSEYDITWVASKISGTSGALGAKAIDLINFLLRFRCATEEFRVVVSDLYDWMEKSSPPWADYCDLVVCRLVALDKRSGVRPLCIGETLRSAIAKLLIRTAWNQAKTECGSLQLCAGLEARI